MGDLKYNGQRAENAITLIWTVLTVELISLVSYYFQYDLLQTIVDGGTVTGEAAKENDLINREINIISTIVHISSAVTFIMWFRRACHNLSLTPSCLQYHEHWTVGCWFVPLINLFKPYQIMKDMYGKTAELLGKNEINTGNLLSLNLIGWWWALWIASNIIAYFSMQYMRDANTVDSLIFVTKAYMIAHAATVISAFVTIRVIGNYSRVELLLQKINSSETVGITDSPFKTQTS
ncbi:MAG: DUF4328 domain-containing protein [Prevotellaceae bacterium]|jgi:hypothetical protein|nr:DUF4328 domain-containing protein [Prevotellaceae bacterium]